MNSDRIIFILFKPAVPGNIGASARAMKTMGFSNLRLIDPCDYHNDEARMMAHGSHDILEKATVFEDFEAAISDMDYLICTTAKQRSAKHDYYSSRDIRTMIQNKKDTLLRIGILFGTEESGLPNQIIQRADLAVTIPMQADYPSLNLAQSVMIMAYELSMLKSTGRKGKDRIPNEKGYRELKQRTGSLLEMINIPSGMPLHHRIMERISILKPGDVSLLHSITSRLLTFISGIK